jgi:hypothetical protein
MNFPRLLLVFFLAILIFNSCRKEEVLTDSSAKLEFSTDTVLFDTVFTSLGSTTKQLLVYNRNNRPIRISSIRLAGGSSSTYRLNVDGIPGKVFSDVEIPEKDSLFIFVEVTVNPNSQLTPFILQDSVLFETNGNQQDIDLVAFGQNARFIVCDSILPAGSSYISYALLDTNLNATITWDNQLPYVIWGGYAVVDSSQTLIIQPGTRIYFANNSGLWVYRYGTIKVQGTQAEPVKFGGVRLESYYQDVPGQWDRIWINEGSNGNEINYAEIRNGFIGIQTESLLDTAPPKKLKLTNTIIHNMSGFGIFSRYYNIEAKNTVVTRSGQYAVALTQGGGYEFRHCTIANYWSEGQRSTPSVYMNDYAVDADETLFEFPLYKADFLNTIIWGNNDEELEIDYQYASNTHQFRNVLLKTESDVSSPNFSNIILNQDPLFMDYTEDDYELQPDSPAKDAGDIQWLDSDTFNDINGTNRQATPDLGAYEED